MNSTVAYADRRGNTPRLEGRHLILSHETIQDGFLLEDQRWPLWNPQHGIFKPPGLPFLLSIRTIYPRKSARIWHDDQRRVHEQIFAGDDDYAFMGTNRGRRTTSGCARRRSVRSRSSTSSGSHLGDTPGDRTDLRRRLERSGSAGTHRLRRAHPRHCGRQGSRRVGAALRPALGQAATASGLIPGGRSRRLRARVRYQEAAARPPAGRRPHHVRRPRAARPAHAPNGIALSKIHHAAFDNHLIGIDPDGRVHVSERLLMLHDGPLLEQSLKGIAGGQIRPPRRRKDHPDRDRLAARFEHVKRVA